MNSPVSDTPIAFPDIVVTIHHSALTTAMRYKDTNTHSYLKYSSAHPKHTEHFILYCQFLRLRSLFIDDQDFDPQSLLMACNFILRLIPNTLIHTPFTWAPFVDPVSALILVFYIDTFTVASFQYYSIPKKAFFTGWEH